MHLCGLEAEYHSLASLLMIQNMQVFFPEVFKLKFIS